MNISCSGTRHPFCLYKCLPTKQCACDSSEFAIDDEFRTALMQRGGLLQGDRGNIVRAVRAGPCTSRTVMQILKGYAPAGKCSLCRKGLGHEACSPRPIFASRHGSLRGCSMHSMPICRSHDMDSACFSCIQLGACLHNALAGMYSCAIHWRIRRGHDGCETLQTVQPCQHCDFFD